MKNQKTNYVLIGCREGCIHRLPSTTELSTQVNPINGELYTVHAIIPHCAMSSECAARRQEIYNRAQAASNAAFERCITVSGKVRAAERDFNRIAAEYTEQPCPFFTASLE